MTFPQRARLLAPLALAATTLAQAAAAKAPTCDAPDVADAYCVRVIGCIAPDQVFEGRAIGIENGRFEVVFDTGAVCAGDFASAEGSDFTLRGDCVGADGVEREMSAELGSSGGDAYAARGRIGDGDFAARLRISERDSRYMLCSPENQAQ